MPSTRNDAELINRIDQTLKHWDKVTLSVHRNIWTVDKPWADWQLCFKVEAEGENGMMTTSGAKNMRELFEQLCDDLDARATRRMTESLTK